MNLFLVEVRVSDLGRAVSWYVDVLGLEETLRDEEGGFAMLRAGAGRIALKAGGTAGGAGRGGVRLTFEVADVDAERSRLVGLGEAVGEVVENRAEGYREARLSDPDGTSITLFGWLRPRP